MAGEILILYVILGAGGAVLCAAGIAYTLREYQEESFMSEEQRVYMRGVRERNLQALAAIVDPRGKRRELESWS